MRNKKMEYIKPKTTVYELQMQQHLLIYSPVGGINGYADPGSGVLVNKHRSHWGDLWSDNDMEF